MAKRKAAKRRRLSGAALVAAARARGIHVGGRRPRRGGHGGFGGRSGSTSVGFLALVAIVLGAILAQLVSLPAILSPAGVALWLYGYFRHNNSARWMGLGLILLGVLDAIGVGRMAAGMLSGKGGGLNLGNLFGMQKTSADGSTFGSLGASLAAIGAAQLTGQPQQGTPQITAGMTPGNAFATGAMQGVVAAINQAGQTGQAAA